MMPDPFAYSHEAVVDRMTEIARGWEANGDRRCIFLGCYARMTESMQAGIAAGRFQDGAWVDGLLHHFAAYYFNALEAYERGDPRMPAVWRLTHEASRRDEVTVLQHLFLGINAHINYDLVLAISDVLNPVWEGLAPPERRKRYEDHRRVNAVIAETVDRVQDEVVERFDPRLDLLDRGLGRLDEWAAARMIAHWRDEVWEEAVRLVETPAGAARDAVRQAAEDRTLRRAKRIL